jgi:hypothetical protein
MMGIDGRRESANEDKRMSKSDVPQLAVSDAYLLELCCLITVERADLI